MCNLPHSSARILIDRGSKGEVGIHGNAQAAPVTGCATSEVRYDEQKKGEIIG